VGVSAVRQAGDDVHFKVRLEAKNAQTIILVSLIYVDFDSLGALVGIRIADEIEEYEDQDCNISGITIILNKSSNIEEGFAIHRPSLSSPLPRWWADCT
jgi:hypothetical protein